MAPNSMARNHQIFALIRQGLARGDLLQATSHNSTGEELINVRRLYD